MQKFVERGSLKKVRKVAPSAVGRLAFKGRFESEVALASDQRAGTAEQVPARMVVKDGRWSRMVQYKSAEINLKLISAIWLQIVCQHRKWPKTAFL